MKSITALFTMLILCSCATNFNKKKKIEIDKILGETVIRQDGNIVNKLQVFDKIGTNSRDIKTLISLKQDYMFALAGVGAGGVVMGLNLIQGGNGRSMLLGGLLVGLGYYFGMVTDKKLTPFLDKHNTRVSDSGFSPLLFQTPGNKSLISGMGYNFSF